MKHDSGKEFKDSVKRVIRYSLIILLIFIIGSLTPYSEIFLGLALGSAVSIVNLIITAKKVNLIGDVATNEVHRTKPVFSGMVTRFGLSILVVLIALEYPQYINLISVIFGIFVAQIVAIIDGIKNN